MACGGFSSRAFEVSSAGEGCTDFRSQSVIDLEDFGAIDELRVR